jgi:MFS-type transporter involved in bile tolerance (Atg22 family)
MFAVSYVWLGALGAFVIGALKPEFSTVKRIAISAISLAIVVLLLIFLVGSV